MQAGPQRCMAGDIPQPDGTIALPETRIFPSGLKARLLTRPAWPWRGGSSDFWVLTSHRQIAGAFPQDPEARIAPSGLKARPLTSSSWPRSGGPRGSWVATSHNRTVASAWPTARVRPSGLKHSSLTLFWPAMGGPKGFSVSASSSLMALSRSSKNDQFFHPGSRPGYQSCDASPSLA